MIVFSNTTPIIALSSIQRLVLLPRLFEQVHLVSEVIDECEAGGPIAYRPCARPHGCKL
jgi:predicted nucleic acid-binding protein